MDFKYPKHRMIMTTRIATILMAMLLLFIMGLSHVITQRGTVHIALDFKLINILVASLSALLIGIYAYYNKLHYLFTLMFGVIIAANLDYQNSFFIIDGKIESLFLGFYLILGSGVIFIMIAPWAELKRKNRDKQVNTLLIIFIIAIYILMKRFIVPNPIIFEGEILKFAEVLMVTFVPFLFAFYYIYQVKKQDLFTFSLFFSTLSFFISIIIHSLFLMNLDYRFEFTARVFEVLTYGGYLVFVPLSLLETIEYEDEVIRKTNDLKNNLFMFFKSAEYNENITVFVNSNHEIIYSNAKYKLFFNNHGTELEKEISHYLTEKYDVIKYNMNYSSSIQVEKGKNTSILDLDVVYIEQNDEEIFCVTAKDSTVIRTMQDSLKRSEYKYRSFFNLIPDFIFLYDVNNNRIIEANDMVYSNFKIAQTNAMGDNLEDKFMGMSFAEYEKLGKKIESGKIIKLEPLHIKNVNGDGFVVEPNFRLLSSEGNSKQMLVFYKDITSTVKLHELRVTNAANIRELEIARENEKMFNEFFANMSHELRTPINIILSALEMMELSPKDEEKVAKYGRFIKHNAYRLTRMVNNILDITKVDSGFYDLDMRNIELIGFIEDIVTSIVHYAHGRGIKIIFDTEVEEHYVAFDLDALERIILNLLSNAIKFSKEDGTIYVEVHRDLEKQKVFIDVRDNGIGIPKENVENIFDRFIQVNKSTIRDNEGTGIGLSIVKKLAVLMGGDCEVTSELGVGTQFRIVLKDEILPGLEKENNMDLLQVREKRVEIEFSDFKK